jgi:hypothetical protein
MMATARQELAHHKELDQAYNEALAEEQERDAHIAGTCWEPGGVSIKPVQVCEDGLCMVCGLPNPFSQEELAAAQLKTRMVLEASHSHAKMIARVLDKALGIGR